MDKVIDIEERIPSMREKRRRKTNKKFVFILAVFFAALLAILYFQSSLSKVEKVMISGATLQESSFYKEQSGLVEGMPVWGFQTSDVKDTLESVNGVKKVTVSRKWFRDIVITIQEWETVAYVEDEGQYSLLLENGETFPAGMLLPEAEAPVLNQFKDDAVRKKMTKQLLKVNQTIYQSISEIIYEGNEVDSDLLTVYMDDGNEVRVIISTFAEKMAFYPDIAAQLTGYEKGVIDLEVGAYFVPFSKEYGGFTEPEEEGEGDEEETE
jgi:cell division protein FtsQ